MGHGDALLESRAAPSLALEEGAVGGFGIGEITGVGEHLYELAQYVGLVAALEWHLHNIFTYLIDQRHYAIPLLRTRTCPTPAPDP